MATIQLARIPGGQITISMEAPLKLASVNTLKNLNEMLSTCRPHPASHGCPRDGDRGVTNVSVTFPADTNDMGVDAAVFEFKQIIQKSLGICDVRVNNMLDIPGPALH